MRKKTIVIDFNEYDSIEDTDQVISDLIQQADANLKNAYAPYSNFRVSSAIKMSNGETVLGTNQENAAYPSGLCAERVAIFAANSKFPNQKVEKIVITTEQSNPTPFSPCGACRQVLIEYEMTQKQPIKVVLKSGNSKIWEFKSVSDILPFAFDGATILKKG